MGKDKPNIAYSAIQNINFSTGDFYNALHESLQDLEPEIEAIRNTANQDSSDTVHLSKSLVYRFISKLGTFTVAAEMYSELAGHRIPNDDADIIALYMEARGYIPANIAWELVNRIKEQQSDLSDTRELYACALRTEGALLECMMMHRGKPTTANIEGNEIRHEICEKLTATNLLLPKIPAI